MIFVTAGHSDHDPGASAHGFVEAKLAKELRGLICDELRKRKIESLNDRDGETLAQVIKRLDPKQSDICLDIHWNAGPEAATGVEVFIPERHTADEVDAAQEIAQLIASTMGIVKRSGKVGKGVKTESESARKTLGILNNEKGINLLVEVCFITNKMDMIKYDTCKLKIADGLADILVKYDLLIS